MKSFHRHMIRLVAGAALLTAAGPAAADPDSCREWRDEHQRWKVEALRRYLDDSPQRELDAAIFELLQREAWLTSCEASIRQSREDLVGWRLVGRVPEEYGSAVAESVLARAGFDVGLGSVLDRVPRMAASRRPAFTRSTRDRRAR